MLDLKIRDNDIVINSAGKLSFAYDSRLVSQKLNIFLSLNEGDFFYDITQGVPWIGFLKNSSSEDYVYLVIFDKLDRLTGVKTVLNIKTKIDEKRNLKVEGSILDVFDKIHTLY